MKELKKLVLLHSNDMHGDFMAKDIDTNLVGGVSMLSGYVSKVRAEEPNTLYCVAGDMFKGSIIDSEFQGLSTIEIMNTISPDIVTVGNHEVDYGVSHLLFIEKCAQFPIINANLHIKTNNARLFEPCKIIEIGGMKILFIGILTDEVLASTKKDGLIGSFVDCAEAAVEIGRICNTYNSLDIDFTVLLTHIGFEEDQKLAKLLDPAWGVDVIIGGHSHTLPEKPADVNGIKIVQAGTGTAQIGRFDIMVDTEKNCIDSFEWKTVEINSENCPRDPQLEELIATYKETTDAKYGRIITRFAKQLTHPSRYMETQVGDLSADALRESLGLDIMLFGSGSLRKPAIGPVVTLKDFSEMYGYDDPVYLLNMTGKQFKDLIRYMFRDEAWEGDHTEFYQVSKGVKVEYSKSKHEFSRFDFDNEPLADDRMLRVGMQEYHYKNIEENLDIPLKDIQANGKVRMISTSVNQVLEEYFLEHPRLTKSGKGRLIINE